MGHSHQTAGGAIQSFNDSRLVFDSAAEAVITTDASYRVRSWNRQAEIMFGWEASEVVGQTLMRYIVPTGEIEAVDREATAELTTPGDEKHSLCIERTLTRRDGNTFSAELVMSSGYSADGWLFAIFVRDASPRKNAEALRHEAEMRDVVIFTLARLAESRDPETGAHIERVQGYCRALAEQMAKIGPYSRIIDSEFIQLMYKTSPLHDIGKVGIPDSVLLKPGRLDEREFEIMKTHTTIGAETLEKAMLRFPGMKFLKMARNIAATHHERFDGKGYPKGLAGEQIPLCGRIVAVADVYDALTSRRVYKAAFTHDVSRSVIIEEAGKQFDPVVVDAFVQIEDKIQMIARMENPQPGMAA